VKLKKVLLKEERSMTQLKWTKKEQDKVIKIVEEAKKVLNLTGWIVYNEFLNGPVQAAQMQNGKQFLTSALSTVTQEYEKITIEWHPALLDGIKRKDELSLKETVYHELIHALTAELYDIALDRFVSEVDCRAAVERLTQRVTRIICTETTNKKK
jgi:hypothetical protein